MSRQNCWEYKKCGRQPGGPNVAPMGMCPAATTLSCDGLNDGTNAGRICWFAGGTFCDGEVQGTYAQKRLSCLTCDFYQMVKKQQGSRFVISTGRALIK